MRLWVINPLYHLHSCITSKIFVVKPMNIPATKEEILENFKQNSNGRPLNKDDYEIAEALSRITYKAYEVGMEDAKQLNMEDMMDNRNALQIFKNEEFGSIRTFVKNGEYWFVGRDVCNAFQDKNPNRSIGRIDDCDKRSLKIKDSLGREQTVTIINESGLYALLFAMQPQRANKDGVSNAYPIEVQERIEKLRRFKRWVTHDVLPTLRKTGSYSMNPQENKPDTQNDAILQVLMKNTEVLQAIVQQNQQIMIALTNLSVNDAKRTMEIQPYTSHQGQKGDGKRSKRITILMSDSERTFVTREARKHGFTAGEYIYNLSVAASKDQIDLG
nr:MAG TPA: repressor domain protein [Caudoviricetes sp.]